MKNMMIVECDLAQNVLNLCCATLAKMKRVLSVIATILLVSFGLFMSTVLYRLEGGMFGIPGDFSFDWSETTVYAPAVASAIGALGGLITLGWLLQTYGVRKETLRRMLVVSSVIWIGFSLGLIVPLVTGTTPAWEKPETTSSGTYDIQIKRIDLPRVISDFGGEGRPGPYVDIDSAGKLWLAMNSPSSIRVGANREFGELGQTSLYRMASVEDLSMELEINLTETYPDIQHIRDLEINQDGIFLANVKTTDEGCMNLQLWNMVLDEKQSEIIEAKLRWESKPCLRPSMSPEGQIGKDQSGGRILSLPSGAILLTVGDFRLGLSVEGQYLGRPEALSKNGWYGKTVAIQKDGRASVFTSGHRNPQGLAMNQATGQIMLSEHGPRGGGELNELSEEKDFGWPDVTYGAPYGSGNLPEENWEEGSRWNSNHDGYEKPLISWLPSIAPSQLAFYSGDEFPSWQGDLLLATLKDESLRRIRLDSGRIVFDERIEIGGRLRDLDVLEDGKLIVSFDGSQIGLISLASPLLYR